MSANKNHPSLMLHIVAGYPSIPASEKIARKILSSGADLLEIQIPFSDPIADGPVIAGANDTALKNGATVARCFKMIGRVIAKTEKPVLIMTYFNVAHRYGIEKFCKRASNAGVRGFIIPDYPFDEEKGNDLIRCSKKYGLSFIAVIASTTRPDRMERIVKNASGFIYCMARTGITGTKTAVSPKTVRYLKDVKSKAGIPIAVGFGISEKSQIKALQPYADIIVIGSALIREYQNKPLEEGLKGVEKFIQKLLP